MSLHDEGLNSLERMVGRRTCIFFEEPKEIQRQNKIDWVVLGALRLYTLYPAAYPNPGNREVNFLPNVALALSLKTTSLSRDADVIWLSVSRRRL